MENTDFSCSRKLDLFASEPQTDLDLIETNILTPARLKNIQGWTQTSKYHQDHLKEFSFQESQLAQHNTIEDITINNLMCRSESPSPMKTKHMLEYSFEKYQESNEFDSCADVKSGFDQNKAVSQNGDDESSSRNDHVIQGLNGYNIASKFALDKLQDCNSMSSGFQNQTQDPQAIQTFGPGRASIPNFDVLNLKNLKLLNDNPSLIPDSNQKISVKIIKHRH